MKEKIIGQLIFWGWLFSFMGYLVWATWGNRGG